MISWIGPLGSTVVNAVASQQEGPEFESTLLVLLVHAFRFLPFYGEFKLKKQKQGHVQVTLQ